MAEAEFVICDFVFGKPASECSANSVENSEHFVDVDFYNYDDDDDEYDTSNLPSWSPLSDGEVERQSFETVSHGRRPTVSAEVYGEAEEAQFCPVPWAKSDADTATLTEMLESHFLFKHLDDRELAKVVLYMEPQTFYPGDIMSEDHEPLDHLSFFHIIAEGQCEVQMNGVMVRNLEAGSTVGETEMMYNQPLRETVIALTVVRSFCIDRRTYQHTLHKTFATKRALHCQFLRNVHFLEGLSQAAMVQLADCLVSRKYRMGELLIRCDTSPKWMFIIMEGIVKVVGRDDDGAAIDVCEFEKGAIVGEMEFLHGHDSVADVIVVSEEVRVARLERNHFELCMGSLKDLLMTSREADPNYRYYNKKHTEILKRAETMLLLENEGSISIEGYSSLGHTPTHQDVALRAFLPSLPSPDMNDHSMSLETLSSRVAEEQARLDDLIEQRNYLEAEVEAMQDRKASLEKEEKEQSRQCAMKASQMQQMQHFQAAVCKFVTTRHQLVSQFEEAQMDFVCNAIQQQSIQLSLHIDRVAEAEAKAAQLNAELNQMFAAEASNIEGMVQKHRREFQAEESRLEMERNALVEKQTLLTQREAIIFEAEAKAGRSLQLLVSRVAEEQARLEEILEKQRQAINGVAISQSQDHGLDGRCSPWNQKNEVLADFKMELENVLKGERSRTEALMQQQWNAMQTEQALLEAQRQALAQERNILIKREAEVAEAERHWQKLTICVATEQQRLEEALKRQRELEANWDAREEALSDQEAAVSHLKLELNQLLTLERNNLQQQQSACQAELLAMRHALDEEREALKAQEAAVKETEAKSQQAMNEMMRHMADEQEKLKAVLLQRSQLTAKVESLELRLHQLQMGLESEEGDDISSKASTSDSDKPPTPPHYAIPVKHYPADPNGPNGAVPHQRTSLSFPIVTPNSTVERQQSLPVVRQLHTQGNCGSSPHCCHFPGCRLCQQLKPTYPSASSPRTRWL